MPSQQNWRQNPNSHQVSEQLSPMSVPAQWIPLSFFLFVSEANSILFYSKDNGDSINTTLWKLLKMKFRLFPRALFCRTAHCYNEPFNSVCLSYIMFKHYRGVLIECWLEFRPDQCPFVLAMYCEVLGFYPVSFTVYSSKFVVLCQSVRKSILRFSKVYSCAPCGHQVEFMSATQMDSPRYCWFRTRLRSAITKL